MGNYLKIVEKAKTAKADDLHPATPNEQGEPATKAPEATKVPVLPGIRKEASRDESDRSDKMSQSFTLLTVSEILAEIHRWGSGASKNAELYRRGELSEEKAIEYVTRAILTRRRQTFELWRHHAPAVRKALGLCIHELEPDVCKVCNGDVRQLIESEGTA